MGLPTRRRRDTAIEVSEEEQRNVIGLPVRATQDQLSAVERTSRARYLRLGRRRTKLGTCGSVINNRSRGRAQATYRS